MTGQLNHSAAIERIDDLRRAADQSRLAAAVNPGRRRDERVRTEQPHRSLVALRSRWMPT